MSSKFVHLHVHSHYSLLDGLPKIDELVSRAKEYGMDTLALTDHGVMYGVIEFYKKCKGAGVCPIIGMEAYVARRSRFDKEARVDVRPYHLTLLARNREGYKNLMKLATSSHLEGYYYKPRLDKELLKEYSRGLIALSGCLQGEIPRLLLRGDGDKAKEAVRFYQEIFGKEFFYLELQGHPEIEDQVKVNQLLTRIGEETGAPIVATGDCHYLDVTDKEAQDVLLCVQTGKLISDKKRLNMTGFDASFATSEKMLQLFKDLPEAIDNTLKIAEMCSLELKLGEWVFPAFAVPGGRTADDYLKELAEQNLKEKYTKTNLTKEVNDRLLYELDIIKKKRYAAYFLVVADVVNWARSRGIIATTRGSAAGSLVSYAIGITTVNPLKYKLPFERFLNPYRPSPPDIDMDFADNRRDEVISYVRGKYGKDKVAQITTFGTMMARGAVRDVTRVLGLPYGFGDKLAKMIPLGSQGFHMTIERALAENSELYKIYEQNKEAKKVFDLAKCVEGCARHASVHAAGIVIAPLALTNYTPLQLEPGSGKNIITQYDMHSIEETGLLKIDFLGIRNLAILGRAVEIVRRTKGVEIDLQNIPLDDKKTYHLISRGETMGLFQLGGSGMTRYLKELKPTKIFDIMAMVALFRPGPINAIPEFIRRKHNPKLIKYLDPRLKDILDTSYGIITYQDDVLLIANKLAGYTWEEADKLRKAMGKKIPKEMTQQKDKFIKGCIDNGLSQEKSNKFWSLIEPFAAYGFNKCLTGDTELVDSDTGRIITINDLYKSNKRVRLFSLDSNLKLKSQIVQSIQNNRIKEVWKIKTKSGRKIKATRGHRFMMVDGWRTLNKLKVGDKVAVARNLPLNINDHPIEDYKLATLGYLLSEGNLCHPHGVYFYSSNRDELEDYKKYASKFSNLRLTENTSKSAISLYTTRINQKKPNELLDWLKDCGLWRKKAVEKFFPGFVFQLSKRQLGLLLGKMWQGDGCINTKKFGSIFYSTSSENIAKGLGHLLLRLGIISTIHQKTFPYRNQSRTGYTINISRFNNIEIFAETIGKHLIGKKHNGLTSLVKNNGVLSGRIPRHAARGSKDVIPAKIIDFIRELMSVKKLSLATVANQTNLSPRLLGRDKRKKGYLRETISIVAGALNSDHFRNLANSDIYWDEIIDIKYVGRKETFDLTMPGIHNFVANDFIVHNSHAASYAVVAYQTAYMKTNYPCEFMTAVLASEANDIDRVSEIATECLRMGIEVLPPDINESLKNFTYIDDKHIRFGLLAIKNIGEDIVKTIIDERERNGKFDSLEDFLERVQTRNLNKKSLEALIKSGAMDNFGERILFLKNAPEMLRFNKEVGQSKQNGQANLFACAGINLSRPNLQWVARSSFLPRIFPQEIFGEGENASETHEEGGEETTEMIRKQKLSWEKEFLGHYVTEHPFKEYEPYVKNMATICKKLSSMKEGENVVVAGIVTNYKEIHTKSGEPMSFIKIEDLSSSVEILVFPHLLKETKAVWQLDKPVILDGRISHKEGDVKILCGRVDGINLENVETIKRKYSSINV